MKPGEARPRRLIWFRRRLTYANVVATLALFLALTGGAVYAASKIGHRDLARNAVHANNIKKGSILASKFAPGVGASVPKSSSGASVPANVAQTSYPLDPLVTFSLKPGEVALLVAEGQASLAATDGGLSCFAFVNAEVDGEAVSEGASSVGFETNDTTLTTLHTSAVIAVISTSGTHEATFQHSGEGCTDASTIDSLDVQVLEIG
jgi:hypothetical protein